LPEGEIRLNFLKVVDNESSCDVLVNMEEIETVQDEGGPTTIALRSGRSVLVTATFDEVCEMLTKSGSVIGADESSA
jgi:hypothetical protein